jgi:protocatechuate 3,4-dioxygenase beta subunit
MEEAQMETPRVHSGIWLALAFLAAGATAFSFHRAQTRPEPPEVANAPANPPWRTTIAPADELGERIVISGQVFAPDGAQPVAGIMVYAYHTDADGHYARNGAIRPPRLQGWAKTDAQGRFEFRTIRPAPYPGRSIPAHVHFILWGAGYPRQWTEELRFQGDPFLTLEMLAASSSAGKFATVCPLQPGPPQNGAASADGAAHCTFNLKVQRTSNFKE